MRHYYVRNRPTRVRLRPAVASIQAHDWARAARMAGIILSRIWCRARTPPQGNMRELQYLAWVIMKDSPDHARKVRRAPPYLYNADASPSPSAPPLTTRNTGRAKVFVRFEQGSAFRFSTSLPQRHMEGAHSQDGSADEFARTILIGTAAQSDAESRGALRTTVQIALGGAQQDASKTPADLNDDDVKALSQQSGNSAGRLPPGDDDARCSAWAARARRTTGPVVAPGSVASAPAWPHQPRALISFERREKDIDSCLGRGGQTSTQIVILTQAAA